MGIHTHGGCGPTSGANSGTAGSNPGLLNALANPQGVCNMPPPCATTAAVSKRNAGTNLDVYTATTPVIGDSVTFTVDTSGFSFATIFGVGNMSTRALDTGDWLLINIDSPILFMTGPLSGPTATTTEVVSNDPAMCGVRIYTQAKLHDVASRPFRLTNSQDLLLGN